MLPICYASGPGNSVGIATDYGLDGPGIESQWGRDFPHLSRPALGPTQPPVQWLPALSLGGKERLGRDADPSPPSSAVVKKEQNYTSTPAIGRTACTERQCLYKGALYLYLYMLGLLWVGFSQGSLKGKDHLENLGTDGMISLEMVFTRSKVDGCGLGLSGSVVSFRETR